MKKDLQDIIDFLNTENKDLLLCINRRMDQMKITRKNWKRLFIQNFRKKIWRMMKILQAFMNSYGADIWDAAIGMYQTFADDKEQNVLKNYILKINELCYGKASVEFSYLECTYRDLLRNEEENDYSVEEDIFEETLKDI